MPQQAQDMNFSNFEKELLFDSSPVYEQKFIEYLRSEDVPDNTQLSYEDLLLTYINRCCSVIHEPGDGLEEKLEQNRVIACSADQASQIENQLGFSERSNSAVGRVRFRRIHFYYMKRDLVEDHSKFLCNIYRSKLISAIFASLSYLLRVGEYSYPDLTLLIISLTSASVVELEKWDVTQAAHAFNKSLKKACNTSCDGGGLEDWKKLYHELVVGEDDEQPKTLINKLIGLIQPGQRLDIFPSARLIESAGQNIALSIDPKATFLKLFTGSVASLASRFRDESEESKVIYENGSFMPAVQYFFQDTYEVLPDQSSGFLILLAADILKWLDSVHGEKNYYWGQLKLSLSNDEISVIMIMKDKDELKVIV